MALLPKTAYPNLTATRAATAATKRATTAPITPPTAEEMPARLLLLVVVEDLEEEEGDAEVGSSVTELLPLVLEENRIRHRIRRVPQLHMDELSRLCDVGAGVNVRLVDRVLNESQVGTLV